MQEPRNYFRTLIENKLVPLLKKYGFTYHVCKPEITDNHDVFKFKRNSSFIDIGVMGFHPQDAPWCFVVLLGKEGFKKTTNEFDQVPLWYIKQKIAPPYHYQRDAIKMNFDEYPLNNTEEITKSVLQACFDLDKFCKDFLKEDFLRFNRIREIKYLEYLVQTQVITERNWIGLNKDVMKPNKELE